MDNICLIVESMVAPHYQIARQKVLRYILGLQKEAWSRHIIKLPDKKVLK